MGDAKDYYDEVEAEAREKYGDRFIKNRKLLSVFVRPMPDHDDKTEIMCVESYYAKLHSVPNSIGIEKENLRRLAQVLLERADELGV